MWKTFNAQELCLFWKGEPHLESCRKMRGKLLKEEEELLQGKHLCVGCLKHGQKSKGHKEKLCWQVCSLMYPTVFHMTIWDDAGNQTGNDNGHKQSVTFVLCIKWSLWICPLHYATVRTFFWIKTLNSKPNPESGRTAKSLNLMSCFSLPITRKTWAIMS